MRVDPNGEYATWFRLEKRPWISTTSTISGGLSAVGLAEVYAITERDDGSSIALPPAYRGATHA